MYIFSEQNTNYWSLSPVKQFEQLEGICFDLIFRKRNEPFEVASLLKRVALNLKTVISDESEIKYYRNNINRLVNQIIDNGVNWSPKYYRH